MTENRRIFFNILATYGRELYQLAIGLCCGRWALMTLGVEDYGLYAVVGGMVGFVLYLNGILSSSIGRFYAIAVGEERKSYEDGLEKCRMWFTAASILQSVVPLLLIVTGYPIGIWAVENFLSIPSGRVQACIWCWRWVCVTAFFDMFFVPLSTMYAAKQYIVEIMIYSVIRTTVRAIALYYMVSHPGDWLAWFAFMSSMLDVIPCILVGLRSYFLFPECRLRWRYFRCWKNIKQLGAFSFWNAWGSLGGMFKGQGIAILVNKYFGASVNTGMNIGSCLSSNCDSLSASMSKAFSPAIYNAWGAGDYGRARALAYQMCKFGTLLILIFALPMALECKEVLRLWLKNPPQYAVEFCQFALAALILDRLSCGQGIAVNASGKIIAFQFFSGSSLILSFPVAWILIVSNVGVYSVGWALVSTTFIYTLGRAWYARRTAAMSLRYWLTRIMAPICLTIAVCLALGVLWRLMMAPSFIRVCFTSIIENLLLFSLSWFWILESVEREFIMEKLRELSGKFRKWSLR